MMYQYYDKNDGWVSMTPEMLKGPRLGAAYRLMQAFNLHRLEFSDNGYLHLFRKVDPALLAHNQDDDTNESSD